MSSHLADFVAQFLRRTEPPERQELASAEARARTLLAMEEALRSQRREERVRRVLLVGAGAALAALFFWWSGAERLSGRQGELVALEAEGTRFERMAAQGDVPDQGWVPSGWSWSPEAVVETAARGDAAFRFEDGTTVALAPSTRAKFEKERSSRRFELQRGQLTLSVQPQAAEARFVVLTDEVSVVVHGTQFSVEKLASAPCPERPATRVRVSEGRVELFHNGEKTFVSAGEAWPAACPEPAPAPAPVPSESVSAPTPPRRPSRGLVPAPVERSRSELEAQNGLFARSVARERAGDIDGAVGALDQLLAQYPSGPLAESAEVARFKLLERKDPERARRAAQDYLARHPDGFGRAEAVRILGREDGR